MSKSNLPAELTDLAARIRAEHEGVCTALRHSLQRALKCGDLLVQAKKLAGHGNWEGWVHQQCDFSLRTAQAYMKLSRHREAVEAKAEDSAFLTIDAALRLIDEEKTDAKKTITVERQESTAKELTLSASKEDRPPEKVPDNEIKAAIDVTNKNLDRQLPSRPAMVVPLNLRASTPALLKGQEQHIIGRQLADVKASIERLVGYARSCNKVTEIISALRAHLDAVEDHDAKVARVPANAGEAAP
jgi:hypothetical protein